MPFQRLPESVQTLYAELLDQAVIAAMRKLPAELRERLTTRFGMATESP